jgi:thiosulfate/3-mercaptopyruvate sulfurtransferase
MVVSTAEVEALINDPAVCIIDARSPVRFRGEQEPIDPVAGHIPSAVNRFHANNLTSSGSFASPAELKSQFEALLNGLPSSKALVYCGSGVTSCHHIVAMASAGLALPRLYAGSWSEWIRSATRPIASGE